MIKIKFAAYVAILMATMAATAAAQQATQAGVGAAIPDGKIAVVNTQVFPGSISELKQKYDQVDNQFKDRFQKLQQADNQLKTMDNELRTKGNAMAPDKVQELQNNMADLKKSAEREYEDLKNAYDREVDKATRPVRDKLYQFLQNYSSQRGIVLVINLASAAQSGTLAYWNPGTDITEDFVAEYNKANPVAGAPAPTTPKPAPATKPPAKP